VLLVSAVLAACGSGKPFPSSPQRLATDDLASTDAMLALGYRPVAVAGSRGVPALAPYLAGTADLGPRAGGSANLDALASARPDAIVGPVSLERQGWGGQLRHIAPTVYYDAAAPSWQATLRAVAHAVGRDSRASQLIGKLGVRARSLRAQLHGRTVAVIRITGPESFVTVNDADPVAALFRHDLGLHNVHLRPQQYPFGCSADAPRSCVTNTLFAAIVTEMAGAGALLVETGWAPVGAVRAFERTAWFRGLPAVRAGRVARAESFEAVGPLGAAFEYSALGRAFGR
jgi:ABC-type Fe3+-hydroxamate transport system substrate-binding protein